MVRTVAYEPFNIPSGSMVPTLLVGDYLFVSKFSYGYSRYSLPFGLPLFSGRIYLPFSQPPQRGDVAVFKLPTDPSTDYIKRIVGLPGDHIQMRHGELYINDQLVPRKPFGEYLYEEGRVGRSCCKQYLEALPRGPATPPKEHRIIKVGNDGPLDNTPVYTVPPGPLFRDGRQPRQFAGQPRAVGRRLCPGRESRRQGAVHLLLDRRFGPLVGDLEMAVRDPLPPACSRASTDRDRTAPGMTDPRHDDA